MNRKFEVWYKRSGDVSHQKDSYLLLVSKREGYIPFHGGATWGSISSCREAGGEEGAVSRSFYCGFLGKKGVREGEQA